MSEPAKVRAKRFFRIAIAAAAICVIATLSAAVLVLNPAPDCSVSPGPDCQYADPEFTRKQEFELEKIGGKSMVYTAQFNAWLVGWFHGAKLALLIAVVALLVAAWCYREAWWLMREDEE
jgi:hypothetical protein